MYVLGIDLGTTYTAAAVWRDGRAEICPLGTRSAEIPSVVLVRADGSVLTGEAAARRAVAEPDRVAREFKRRLGDSIPVLLGGAPFSAEALMGRLLAAVMKTVADREGGLPTRVCLSHPANWGPYKMDLLRQAVVLADLHVPVTFTTEPEAAAVAYARQERLSPGETVAVYDLGGGTFDAAVLRRTDTGFSILGQPEGIERLGGIDIDAAVFAHVARTVGEPLTELDEDDPNAIAAMARLREECTDAKEALSSDVDTTIPVLLPNLTTEVRLTRAELEAMVRPPLYDSIEALQRALRSADVTPEGLSAVLLVGGSSRIPLIAQLVGAELGRPVAIDTHPKHAIATGAAWLASGAALPTEPAPATTVVTVYPPSGMVSRAPAGPAPATVAVTATPPPGTPQRTAYPPPPPTPYPPNAVPRTGPTTSPPGHLAPQSRPSPQVHTSPPGHAYPGARQYPQAPGYPVGPRPPATPQPGGQPRPTGPGGYPQAAPGYPPQAPTPLPGRRATGPLTPPPGAAPGRPFTAPTARVPAPLPDLPAPTPPPSARRARDRWLLPLAAATVMLLLIAIVAAWQLSRGEDTDPTGSASTLVPSLSGTAAAAAAPAPSTTAAASSATTSGAAGAGGAPGGAGGPTTSQQVTLTVSVSGTGKVSGAVSCSSGPCTGRFPAGRTVTLTAGATSPFVFSGWSGCTTTSGPTCTVTLKGSTTVRATFAEAVNPIDTITESITPTVPATTTKPPTSSPPPPTTAPTTTAPSTTAAASTPSAPWGTSGS